MNYKGVIIEESLQNASTLEEIKILETKVEAITPEHKTPWLKHWTLHTIEVPEEIASKFAEKVSKTIETEHSAWYADYKNEKWHYIIFPDKVFKIDKTSAEQYKQAKQYGISLGIPEYQVDFAPEDKVWER